MLRSILHACLLFAFCTPLFAQEPPPPVPPDEPPVEKGDPEPEQPVEPAKGYAHRVKKTTRKGEDRVLAALKWLEDHQSRGGDWIANEFAEASTRDGAKKTGNIEFDLGADRDNGWKDTNNIGLTGLAMLAFTGNGYNHKSGDYKRVLRMGILSLRKVQDNDGCFGPKDDDHFVYNHAIAAMAMAEAYGLSQDAVLKPIVEKAVEFILKAQNPGLGWRYGVQPGISDTSVTTWMVMALHAAKLAGIETDVKQSYDDAAAWLKRVTTPVNKVPKTGYDSPGSNNARLRSAQEFEHNGTMDAMHVKCLLAMEKAKPKDKDLKALAGSFNTKDALPQWDRFKIDLYYWYYATSALYALGGKEWKAWKKQLDEVLQDHQRGFCKQDKDAKLDTPEALDEHGSWDPVGAWGTAGGRVYSTAIAALALETEWREE
ncbi:MAG: hypothetical protein H6839_14905 [Planctomycetes bacterium]|nr:hypothetical protein [Planctomycetota bacterium]